MCENEERCTTTVPWVVVLILCLQYQHNMWCKMSNFELGVRVPWMVHVPGVERCSGVHTTALAELVDVYPTLADLAGMFFHCTFYHCTSQFIGPNTFILIIMQLLRGSPIILASGNSTFYHYVPGWSGSTGMYAKAGLEAEGIPHQELHNTC